MKRPWARHSKTDDQHREAEDRYQAARAHLRILVNELQQTLERIERIEDERRRGIPGA